MNTNNDALRTAEIERIRCESPAGVLMREYKIDAEDQRTIIDHVLTAALAALQKCPCDASSCIEPWEPGCGLGNSIEHARIATPPPASERGEPSNLATQPSNPAPLPSKPARKGEAPAAGDAVRLRALIPALQSMRDRMLRALPPKFGDGFDGDMDTLLETINAIRRAEFAQTGGEE